MQRVKRDSEGKASSRASRRRGSKSEMSNPDFVGRLRGCELGIAPASSSGRYMQVEAAEIEQCFRQEATYAEIRPLSWQVRGSEDRLTALQSLRVCLSAPSTNTSHEVGRDALLLPALAATGCGSARRSPRHHGARDSALRRASSVQLVGGDEALYTQDLDRLAGGVRVSSTRQNIETRLTFRS